MHTIQRFYVQSKKEILLQDYIYFMNMMIFNHPDQN